MVARILETFTVLCTLQTGLRVSNPHTIDLTKLTNLTYSLIGLETQVYYQIIPLINYNYIDINYQHST